MFIHNLNPTLLTLGPLEIRYYGLVYVLGFILSITWLFYLRKKQKLPLTKDQVWDFTFYLLLGVLVGSRLFMVFWQPQTYLLRPWNLLKFWQGGMSFHGGFVGITLAGYWYCKKNNLNLAKMADLLTIPTIFALALGRIANFINGELVGRPSTRPWCTIFPKYDQTCRHPSTLYAAGKRFFVFFWLFFLTFYKQFKPGFIFWNFVFWEGLGRIIVDFYREDLLYFGFSLGQWFSLAMVLTALIIFLKYYREDWKKIFWRKNK